MHRNGSSPPATSPLWIGRIQTAAHRVHMCTWSTCGAALESITASRSQTGSFGCVQRATGIRDSTIVGSLRTSTVPHGRTAPRCSSSLLRSYGRCAPSLTCIDCCTILCWRQSYSIASQSSRRSRVPTLRSVPLPRRSCRATASASRCQTSWRWSRAHRTLPRSPLPGPHPPLHSLPSSPRRRCASRSLRAARALPERSCTPSTFCASPSSAETRSRRDGHCSTCPQYTTARAAHELWMACARR
mmetsp:Transcript_38656/g.101973  ORF Transcript_38656/g.101973 Transcript_38656/m.101973 type:complete len:244 (-) Transcript_38656:1042-1773(-)